MKTLVITLSAFLFVATAHSQNPDKALIKVLYTFTHIRDTTHRDKPYIENMFLIAGKNAARYMSYDAIDGGVHRMIQSLEMRKNGIPQAQINAQLYGPAHVPLTLPTQYYFFFKEHKFFSMEHVNNAFLIEDAFPIINWKITKDTLSFSGIHCQKALASFAGRNWIAWFATELPFESGPWKLNGLPGLIIDAYDDKKEVEFKFADLHKIIEGDLAINDAASLPEMNRSAFPGLTITEVAFPPVKEVHAGGYVRTIRKDFEKLKKAFAENPPVSSGGGGGGGGNSNNPPVISQSPSMVKWPTVVINNPIELPEKK